MTQCDTSDTLPAGTLYASDRVCSESDSACMLSLLSHFRHISAVTFAVSERDILTPIESIR